MVESSDKGIVEEQCDFRKDGNCSDRIFFVRSLSKKNMKKTDFSSIYGPRKAYCRQKSGAMWLVKSSCQGTGHVGGDSGVKKSFG